MNLTMTMQRTTQTRDRRAAVSASPSIVLGVLVIAALAGCLDADARGPPSDHPAHPGPVCTDRCAVPVEDGETRSHESSVARNPLDPDHILVGASAWVRDGTLGSCLLAGTPAETCPMFGPTQLWRHVSFDGGTTWDAAPFPGDVPADHPLAVPAVWADPNVAFLADGTAVYIGMYGKGGESFDIFFARSQDGGLSWPEGTIIAGAPSTIAGTPPTPAGPMSSVMDQPFLAVGPDGTLLLSWAWYYDHGFERKDLAAAVSGDGGITWSDPAFLSDDCDCSNGRPAITADGTMYVAYRDRGVPHAAPVWIGRSGDGGASWNTWQVPGLASTEYVDLEADGDALMMTYTEAGPDGQETTYLLGSEDGGRTWTSLELRTGPWKNDPDRVGSIGPALAVGPDGTAFVLDYAIGDEGRMNVVAMRINPDGTVASQPVTDSPLAQNRYHGTLAAIGGPEWSIYGDYSGLFADELGAIATWVGGDPDNPDLMASFLEFPAWPGGHNPPGLGDPAS